MFGLGKKKKQEGIDLLAKANDIIVKLQKRLDNADKYPPKNKEERIAVLLHSYFCRLDHKDNTSCCWDKEGWEHRDRGFYRIQAGMLLHLFPDEEKLAKVIEIIRKIG